ncbi:MAG: hypothetical protein ACERKV_06440 [Clostridiaceae bacterium]
MISILPLIMGAGYSLCPVIIGNAIEYISITTVWKYLGLIMIFSTTFMYFLSKYDEKQTITKI